MRLFFKICQFIFINILFLPLLMAFKNMQRSAVMQVPLWIIYIVLPLGAALSTLQYALKTVYYFRVNPADLAEAPVEDPAEINLLDLN